LCKHHQSHALAILPLGKDVIVLEAGGPLTLCPCKALTLFIKPTAGHFIELSWTMIVLGVTLDHELLNYITRMESDTPKGVRLK
jgi:hypothetical protein